MGVHNTGVYPEVKKLLEIPDDEPIFIIRGKDMAGSGAVVAYAWGANGVGATPAFVRGVLDCAAEFLAFAEEHPKRIKRPD